MRCGSSMPNLNERFPNLTRSRRGKRVEVSRAPIGPGCRPIDSDCGISKASGRRIGVRARARGFVPAPGTATALSELLGGCREKVTKGPDRVLNEERTHHGDLHREASSRSLPQAWAELRAHCDS